MKGPVKIFLFFNLLLLRIAFAQPNADFSATVLSGCSPLIVQFNNLSSGNVNYYHWTFGNGNSSDKKNPASLYSNPGIYTVALIAGDTVSGQYDTTQKTGYIIVFAGPVAGFNSDKTQGCIPMTVNFTDLSNPVSSTITEWYWDFGDGSKSSQKNPTHTYTSAGEFTIYLIVKDANGCQDVLFMDKYITAGQVIAGISSGNYYCSKTPTVNFQNVSSGQSLTYLWDFDDGGSSTLQNPVHNYPSSDDTFYVKLIASDNLGCSDTLIHDIYLIDLKADFVYAVSCADDSTDSTFTVSFSDISTPFSSVWAWNFGDNEFSTNQNPSHQFDTLQAYPITLIANAGFNCADTIQKIYIPPTALFTPDSSSSCETPFTVTFQNQSIGTDSIFFQWDFGDGGVSTDTNPTHTYLYEDSFFVRLIVSNKFACSDTIIDTIVIIYPVLDFVGDTLYGCKPLTVNFTDMSFSEISPITSWEWNFGDPASGGNNISTLPTPTHIYNDTGKFTVTLIITTSLGCKDTLQKENYIQVGIPPDFVDFTINPMKSCIKAVQFLDLSGFIDPTTKVNCWNWEFYDDFAFGRVKVGESTEQNPTYNKFARQPDSAVIVLNAGHNGCYRRFERKYEICKCKCSPKPGKLASCAAPYSFTIEDTSSGFDLFLGYTITNRQTGEITNYSNPTTTIIFPAAGIYEITAAVYNSVEDYTDTKTFILTIDSFEQKLFAAPIVSCLKNNVFSFADTSVSHYGKIVEWEWDFGDGKMLTNNGAGGNDTLQPGVHNDSTFGTFRKPFHIYKDTGTYHVTLNMMVFVPRDGDYTLPDTCYYFIDTFIVIHDINANFGFRLLKNCLNEAIVGFTDSSISTTKITSWEWNFGDGSPPDISQNPTHTYTNPGKYTVTLIVQDSIGCIDSVKKTDVIDNIPLDANFSMPDSICENDSVLMVNNSTGDSIICIWNFGDGSPADSTFAPKHLFPIGTYKVLLKIVDMYGCSDTVSHDITILPQPVADFISDINQSNCQPLIVNFTDKSIGDNLSYNWDFGDGAFSTLKNPSHIYTANGNFDVRLTVVNSIGCSDDTLVPSFIKILGPSGTLRILEDTVCYPDSVTFIASSQNAAYYIWDFGDGELKVYDLSEMKDTVGHHYQLAGTFIPSLLIYDANQLCPYIIPDTHKVLMQVLSPDFLSDKYFLCKLDTVYFSDSSDSKLPVMNWHWNFGDGDSVDINTKNTSHYFDTTGTYNVVMTVADSFGCVAKINKIITVNESPQLVMNSSVQEGCVPLAVEFTAVSPLADFDQSLLHWDFDDGTVTSGDSAEHTFSESGKFNVTLTVNYAQGNCSIDSNFLVEAVAVPSVQFDVIPSGDNCLFNSRFYFKNNTVNAENYFWQFGDSSISYAQNPDFQFPDSGTYTIKLIAYNKLNCADSAETTLLAYDNSELFTVPNVFTPYPASPNQNDVFEIPGLPDISSIKIYNRWGEKIFEENPYQNKWDGRDMKTNQPLEAGVYYYILKFCDERVITGYVHIIHEKK